MAVKKNKKNITIIGATAMTLFSLVTAFTATIAWFAQNKNVSSSGMAVKIGRLTGRLQYVEFHNYEDIIPEQRDEEDKIVVQKLYKFKKQADATINYDYSSGSASISGNTFIMDTYSPLIQEHPLLVVFAFDTEYTSENDGDIFVRGTTSIEDFLGTTKSDGTPYYPLVPNSTNKAFVKRELSSEDIDGAYLDETDNKYYIDYYASSSVINFKSRSFTRNEYQSLISDSNSTIDISNGEIDEYSNFVTIDKDNPENVSFVQEPTIYSATAGKKVMYIATVVNYYPEAISIIYSTYLGNLRLENTYGGTLHYACDWSLEVF